MSMTQGALVALVTSVLILPAAAQTERERDARDEEGRVQELVGELQELVDRAESRRAADAAFIKDLRALAQRYEWLWTVELLHDTFRDGDYTRDPAWTVTAGEFRVERGVLQSTATGKAAPAEQAAAEEEQPKDLAQALLGALVERYAKQQGVSPQEARAEVAEIYVPQAITNAFAIALRITPQSDQGRLELGPYQGDDRSGGYRLAYAPGSRPGLELLRVSARGSAVVEAYDQPLGLRNGQTYLLQWMRNRDGEMSVMLDGKELFTATDRAYKDDFGGFTLANLGGGYGIDEVTISGTGRPR
jgi:hypothetical protein